MDGELGFREATRDDLPEIVRLLGDDPLGSGRERDVTPLPSACEAAFEAIDRDGHHALLVAEVCGEVIGVLQLTLIPCLTHGGSWRAQIEGVRIDRRFRSLGVGSELVARAVERSRQRGCRMVQLTSDKRRPEAHAFHERLGFVASHHGFKLLLEPGRDPGR